MKPECPYCGKEFSFIYQVTNHIRMKADKDHGPQGKYPEDWTEEETTGSDWIKIDDLEDPKHTKDRLHNMGYTEVNKFTGELR